MYFFSWNFMHYPQKDPIKAKIWWSFTWPVESLKLHSLIGSFYPNHIKFRLKKYRRVISQTLKSDSKFKEKLTCGFKYYMGALVNLFQTLKRLKTSRQLASTGRIRVYILEVVDWSQVSNQPSQLESTAATWISGS